MFTQETKSPIVFFEKSSFKIDKKHYWWASWYSYTLGYETLKAFMSPIHKAIKTCSNMNIKIEDHFVLTERVIDEFHFEDYRLSRLACYLIALNFDEREETVIQARQYFAVDNEYITRLVAAAFAFDKTLMTK